jgi:glycosyltransferase involved in cell wall biosynthesis
MARLNTIAVDLIPVLPGGDNGGAKILVLGLIRQLALDHPDTHFVLLTHEASHRELAVLDAPNVSRQLVWPATSRWNAWPRANNAISNWRALRFLAPLYRLFYRLWVQSVRQNSVALLDQLKADLLFCPFTLSIFRQPQIPTVGIVYDLQHRSYAQFFTRAEILRRDQELGEACRLNSRIAVISNYVRSTLLDQMHIEPERVSTIYIRMAHWFSGAVADSEKKLRRFALEPQKFFLYPANYWRHKNHESLIAAFAKARSAGLPAQMKLVFTGAPSERMSELQKIAEAAGLAQDVCFLGFLSTDEFQAVLGAARAVVFPSLYEGFGMPVVEAMAVGCPVACSRGTSLTEIAADAALLFDPRASDEIAYAMIRLAANDSLRADLITRGKQRAAFFRDTREMTREYWRLMEQAAGDIRIADCVCGIYTDGWAGPNVSISYLPGKEPRSIDIECYAPQWIPLRQIDITVFDREDHLIGTYPLTVGALATISIPIGAKAGIMQLRFGLFMRPAELLPVDDMREICLSVQQICVREQGVSRPIFEVAPRAAG